MTAVPDNDEDRIAEIKARMPDSGLFAGKTWRLSPRPLALPRKVVKEIEGLGRRLQLFLRASNEIYLRSVKGTLPDWIAGYLDAGKPERIVKWGRESAFREDLPRVIRPDLLLGEDGKLSMTEIDNLPGGIGLTAWLNKTYSDLGFDVIGGPRGMIDGFRGIFEGPADVVVSEESGDYRPEMEWIVGQIDDGWNVVEAESYKPCGRDVYRFFELFDLEAIAHGEEVFKEAGDGLLELTALPKAFLEEKMWSAIFWNPSLQETWKTAVRGAHLKRLRELIPFSWALDPEPLPHFGVLPRLGLNAWSEVADMSQKDRRLVLKISGFSELAWGSRGVHIGHDLSQEEWGIAIRKAMAEFPKNPWVMQDFSPSMVVRHSVWDLEEGVGMDEDLRVRLCPYYFAVRNGARPEVKLGGILATLVPSDKKVLHGMSEATLVPCMMESSGLKSIAE